MSSNVFYFFYDTANSNFFAIDDASGGYPYWTSNPGSAKYWKNEKDAIKYINSFPDFKAVAHLKQIDYCEVPYFSIF